MTKIVLSLCLILFLFACTEDKPATPGPDPVTKDTVPLAAYNTDTLPVSDRYALTSSLALKADSLKEISGLAASTVSDGSHFWAEEDSGNKPAIYLLDTSGGLQGIKYLAGALNLDWEDMAGGPGPEPGKYYLYVGDIGDNLNIRPFITVYRFEEPDPYESKDALVNAFDIINLAYPDGHHNAEALMVDPLAKDIYIITKDSVAGLYVAPYPQNTKAMTQLTLLGTLPIANVTAADIYREGNRVLIKNYDDIFYWEKAPGETIATCLQRTPLRLKYTKEPQGEAIAFMYLTAGFRTVSEEAAGIAPVIYHYESF